MRGRWTVAAEMQMNGSAGTSSRQIERALAGWGGGGSSRKHWRGGGSGIKQWQGEGGAVAESSGGGRWAGSSEKQWRGWVGRQ